MGQHNEKSDTQDFPIVEAECYLHNENMLREILDYIIR